MYKTLCVTDSTFLPSRAKRTVEWDNCNASLAHNYYRQRVYNFTTNVVNEELLSNTRQIIFYFNCPTLNPLRIKLADDTSQSYDYNINKKQ